MPDPSQFNIGRTNTGRWTITFEQPADQHICPPTIVELGDVDRDRPRDGLVREGGSVPVGQSRFFSSPISVRGQGG